MNERVKLLEAVAEAARADMGEWSVTTRQALQTALDALDALPAQPQGETVGKVVQIAAISGNDEVAACVLALRDDGSIWGKRVDRDGAKWWREDDIPADVEVTP